MLWITRVVSILKVGFEDPILVASPKDSLDSIAVEHRARRYSAGDIRDSVTVSRSGSGVGDGWLCTDPDMIDEHFLPTMVRLTQPVSPHSCSSVLQSDYYQDQRPSRPHHHPPGGGPPTEITQPTHMHTSQLAHPRTTNIPIQSYSTKPRRNFIIVSNSRPSTYIQVGVPEQEANAIPLNLISRITHRRMGTYAVFSRSYFPILCHHI
jgi:hypothetical protein